MPQSSNALTVKEACAKLGLDPQARDLLGGLQGAFQRAIRSARTADAEGVAEPYGELLDAYRFLRGLGPVEPPEDRKFEDWPSQILLTPVEAVTGGLKTGRLPTGRPFTTRLPPGLRDGDLVWVWGWLIQARIEAGADISIKGDDIWVTARKGESALKSGQRITVETPMGPWSFRLSDAAVEQMLVRVPGAGLPAARRHAAGDLYVRFEIDAEADKGPAALLRRLAHIRAA